MSQCVCHLFVVMFLTTINHHHTPPLLHNPHSLLPSLFCHLLLTVPFSSNLDAPSRLSQWERSLHPLPSYLVSLVFKPSKFIPTFLNLSTQRPSRAAWVCHLVASVGVFMASLLPGGTYDSSDPCRRLSLSQACLTSFRLRRFVYLS